MKKYFVTLIMTLVLALGCMGSALAAESNLVGYVNVERVFRNHPDMQATMSVLKLERQKAQQEFEAKAPSLDDKGKQELGQKLSEQVDKKEASLASTLSCIHSFSSHTVSCSTRRIRTGSAGIRVPPSAARRFPA